ncbi:hypothetical protein BDZ85DRAFT_114542 [Elsinoe ampelina]|uniref:Uncharacterized protein n=1 Tax=Elsinoe ampelina TaxID=302913 RepID=A0A6A6GDT8_9PEZI|nr:hypothetical protein BDZ85DRAFT_114542 [Elsinoe ampelina]
MSQGAPQPPSPTRNPFPSTTTPCRTCVGTGRKTTPCQTCDGTGVYTRECTWSNCEKGKDIRRWPEVKDAVCPHCDGEWQKEVACDCGTGSVDEGPCADCAGRGRVNFEMNSAELLRVMGERAEWARREKERWEREERRRGGG